MSDSRNIQEFKGRNVVIGCGHPPTGGSLICDGRRHPAEDYYSLDVEGQNPPDMKLDLRIKDLPQVLHERFTVTFLEHLDANAYNNQFNKNGVKHNEANCGDRGLQNALKMTKLDGFIVILGCPQQKEFRHSVQGLKYIHLSIDDGCDDIVIIPKNQALSIEKLKAQIRLCQPLYDLLNAIFHEPYVQLENKIKYCEFPYTDMPTFREIIYPNCLPKEVDTHVDNKTTAIVKDSENLIPELVSQQLYRSSNVKPLLTKEGDKIRASIHEKKSCNNLHVEPSKAEPSKSVDNLRCNNKHFKNFDTLGSVLGRLLQVTHFYLTKTNGNEEKKNIFRNLEKILKDPTIMEHEERISKFKSAIIVVNLAILARHRTQTWKRYLYNVFSILAVIPAIVKARKSNKKYSTLRFWQPESKRAIQAAKGIIMRLDRS